MLAVSQNVIRCSEGLELQWIGAFHICASCASMGCRKLQTGSAAWCPYNYPTLLLCSLARLATTYIEKTSTFAISSTVHDSNLNMPVPFGFSVGDFLAVMELTWKVTQALRDSEGAVHDVQTILETLMSFQRAISTCQTLALEWMRLSDADASLPERSLVNGINYQLKFCRERLLKLSAKLEPYTRALMKQKGTRTTWDHLHKVKWIFSREEADSLQKDLSIHVQGLERYIAELGM
jgi:hypothetical protein